MNTLKQKVEFAIKDIQQGKMVLLIDDESRENEGDLVASAQLITPQVINFMAHQGCGLICMPMMAADFSRLGIPMMAKKNNSHFGTAFGVSIGAKHNITSGISAFDRAKSVQVAADPQATAADIVMPGHIFPLKSNDNGVLARRGHTEGSTDLMKLAGLSPQAVICEVMNEDGTMARLPELKTFAKRHALKIISIDELVRYRQQQQLGVEEIASAQLPAQNNHEFTIKVFADKKSGEEVVALLSQTQASDAPLVRLHSECLTGDVFGSQRCDCGAQLAVALQRISEHGGALVYLRQEGRGIGLANKIKAYALQEQGLDTVEANQCLGFKADERDYKVAAEVLKALNMTTIRLLTNNPKKLNELGLHGVKVQAREAIEIDPSTHNLNYLKTKKHKMGHLMDLIEGASHANCDSRQRV